MPVTIDVGGCRHSSRLWDTRAETTKTDSQNISSARKCIRKKGLPSSFSKTSFLRKLFAFSRLALIFPALKRYQRAQALHLIVQRGCKNWSVEAICSKRSLVLIMIRLLCKYLRWHPRRWREGSVGKRAWIGWVKFEHLQIVVNDSDVRRIALHSVDVTDETRGALEAVSSNIAERHIDYEVLG